MISKVVFLFWDFFYLTHANSGSVLVGPALFDGTWGETSQ